MDREKFIQSGMIKFGDFTLTSGKKSTYYVDIKEAYLLYMHNKYTIMESKIIFALDVYDYNTAVDLAGKTIYGTVAGMELGAVPLIVGISLKTGKPYIIIRKGEGPT